MGKSILSVYVEDEIKTLIHKDVAERNLANPSGKRVKLSNVLEDIIMQYYLRRQNPQTETL